MGLMAAGHPLAGIHDSSGLGPRMGTFPVARSRIRGSSHRKTTFLVALDRPCPADHSRCKLVSCVGMVKSRPLAESFDRLRTNGNLRRPIQVGS